jgi:AraC-like DNA-binding protein
MEPTVYRPQGALARFVEYFWTFEWRQGEAGQPLKMFATGVSGILFQHHDGRPALGSTAQGHPVAQGGCPTSFVYGKRTRPSQTFAKGPFGLTGVVFKPQGLSTLLNSHPMQFNDGSVELNEFSRDNISEQLLEARSHQERVARLSGFLRAQVDGSGPEDVLVAESLWLIQKGIRSIRVPHVLKCLKVSERQFERRFVRAIGVSPHQYIRIVRFREAMRLMKANRFERLSDVAYDLGYVDQSHFIKDVRAFSGYAPTGLAQTVRAGIDLPCALIPVATHGSSPDRGDRFGRSAPGVPPTVTSARGPRSSDVGHCPVVPSGP